MNMLEDALPFMETDEERVEELGKLIKYLSNCELANKSFVPAGFQFLSAETRSEIDREVERLKEAEKSPMPTGLERVDPRGMFAETFPFWTPPYPSDNKSFRYGDRVVNINTSRRKFIPFGELGTVIGFTLKDLIIRFDEPNVVLTDVHDTCLPYTGAVVPPTCLVNLTQRHEANSKNQQHMQQNYRKYNQGKGDHPKFNKKSSSYKGGNSKYESGTKGYGSFNPKKGGKKFFQSKGHF